MAGSFDIPVQVDWVAAGRNNNHCDDDNDDVGNDCRPNDPLVRGSKIQSEQCNCNADLLQSNSENVDWLSDEQVLERKEHLIFAKIFNVSSISIVNHNDRHANLPSCEHLDRESDTSHIFKDCG